MALGFNPGQECFPQSVCKCSYTYVLQLNFSSFFWKSFLFLAGTSRDEDGKLGEGWQIRMQMHYFGILDTMSVRNGH